MFHNILVFNPSVAPGSLQGRETPVTIPAALSLSGMNRAHAAAYELPADQERIANLGRASWSASSQTSYGQSTNRRAFWNVDRPMPGRSREINRAFRRFATSSTGKALKPSRELGQPGKNKTGLPSVSPNSAYPSIRPSANRIV
jgi:hypothetical protein